MRRIWLLSPFLLVALCGCISLPPQPAEEPDETTFTGDRVELPTTFIHGRPFVDLKVNGQGPFRFLVDTGTGGMCITPLVVRDAQVVPSRYTARIGIAAGIGEDCTVALLNRVEATGVSFKGVGAYVLNPKAVELLGWRVGKDFGGIIGMQTLKNLILEIDYPQQKVALIWPGKASFPAAEGIPYTEDRPHITIETPSPKYPELTVVLDTGLDEVLALTDVASYPARVGLIKKDGLFGGIGGAWRPRFGQLAGEVHVGPATWRDPAITESPDTAENLLGSHALESWKVVVDQQAKKIWLLNGELTTTTTWSGPLDPDGRPAVYGFVSKRAGDEFVITVVDSGSRAERAGLKVGDHARRADLPSDGKDPVPNQIRLHITRGTESFEISMSLTDSTPPVSAAVQAQ